MLTTARDVLHPRHVRDALRLNPSHAPAAELAAALRCGAAVALALTLAAATGHQHLAGFAALGALSTLYGRFDPYRRRAVVALLFGGVLTGAFAAVAVLTTAGASAVVVVVATAGIAAGAAVLCHLVRTGPPGATIVVFAAAGGMAGGLTWADVGTRTLAVAAGAAVAWLVTMSGVVTGPHRQSPAAPPTLRDDVRAARTHGGWRPAGARVALASVAAGTLALVAGFGHPAWAQMGSTAVLQGPTAGHTVVRALQRGAGTVVGALLAWPLLAADLGFTATCAVVVALQVVTEVVVGRHYGLAMLTITPMALLMTSLTVSADPATLARDRALDTLLGVGFGVLAVVLVHPRTGRHATAGRAGGAAAS